MGAIRRLPQHFDHGSPQVRPTQPPLIVQEQLHSIRNACWIDASRFSPDSSQRMRPQVIGCLLSRDSVLNCVAMADTTGRDHTLAPWIGLLLTACGAFSSGLPFIGFPAA